MQFPHSPTGTIVLQKKFAIAIRKVFKNNLKGIYDYLEKQNSSLKESLLLKSEIDKSSMQFILNMLEKTKLDLSPVVMSHLSMTWLKSNEKATTLLKRTGYTPFNKRTLRIVEENAYRYLNRFVGKKHDDLVKILSSGITQGDTSKTIAKEIKDSFRTTSWKSEQIARTEVIRTSAISTKDTILRSGVTRKYQWLTSLKENVCPICRPLHGRIFNVNDPRSPMPIKNTHPNCNCGIIPYVEI